MFPSSRLRRQRKAISFPAGWQIIPIAGKYWTSGAADGLGGWRWTGNLEANFDDFTKWGVGQPDSDMVKQRVALNFQSLAAVFWESEDDTMSMRYICEVEDSGTPTSPQPTVTTTTPTTTTPTTTPPPVNECNARKALFIVLESSSHVGSANFQLGKQFAADLSRAFTGLSTSKLGFLTYALIYHVRVHLHNSDSPEEIVSDILSAAYEGHSTRNTAEGMLAAKLQLETYSSGNPMHMVVLTNGVSASPSTTKHIADLANLVGIRTYAIGVSMPDSADQELLNIAGQYSDRVFKTDWARLDTILGSVVNKVCNS
ncbi:uncharacterized protein LOC118435359 [Folsomia candida]|uniref:uncharacterized protein LOC118435359 n=1 Tax=Folsomia candida TaxID=158441 RepID=UPI001604EBC6|nr:uncharacterized protein LOC118435359 [Folsomia candida]